jgi:hypothetical protein
VGKACGFCEDEEEEGAGNEAETKRELRPLPRCVVVGEEEEEEEAGEGVGREGEDMYNNGLAVSSVGTSLRRRKEDEVEDGGTGATEEDDGGEEES